MPNEAARMRMKLVDGLDQGKVQSEEMRILFQALIEMAGAIEAIERRLAHLERR